MRYSLVLPRGEPNDGAEVRKALDTARDFWERGDARNALQWLRRAAWACANGGREGRAVAINKAAKSIQSHLETPYDSSKSSDDALQASARAGAGPAPKSSRPGASPSSPRQSQRPGATSKRVSQRPTTRKRTPAAGDAVVRVAEAPPASEARPSSPDFDGAADLVVTVSAEEWHGTEAAHLVGHNAVRVAVTSHGKDGSLVVRPLRAGEVAPKNASVALLVSFEPALRAARAD